VRPFRKKVLREAFLYLDFKVCTFWRKNIGTKAARNVLVKLTPGACQTQTPLWAAETTKTAEGSAKRS
jgi:hypothetical protein